MMLRSTTREAELATITVRSTDGREELKVDVTNVEKGELLMLQNPNYQALINSRAHLVGVANGGQRPGTLPADTSGPWSERVRCDQI